MRWLAPTTDYAAYVSAWDKVAGAGLRSLNIDTWAAGRRYLSLTSLVLNAAEADQLERVTVRFSPLIDTAVEGILHDSEWWSALAWPWPAIELARQEPLHPGGHASLYGRFDCLLDQAGVWQVIEFNADTPSGGREASGLEPCIARKCPPLQGLSRRFASRLVGALLARIDQHPSAVGVVGIVSSHAWLEDMAQATWLGWLLRRAGQATLVGDVTDLATTQHGRILLRGQPIDALYRFYPVERLYRHAIFASLCDASLDGRLLLLNGLRGFLAQSKACLAWLWSNRARLDALACATVERHLPPTLLARDPSAAGWVPRSVVKHVNGREGDSVVFGDSLDATAWEARLIEPGYVVQQVVSSQVLEDVEVDDVQRRVRLVGPRYACVGAFAIGGQFGGCYTRLDSAVTTARATYAATLREPPAAPRRR